MATIGATPNSTEVIYPPRFNYSRITPSASQVKDRVDFRDLRKYFILRLNPTVACHFSSNSGEQLFRISSVSSGRAFFFHKAEYRLHSSPNEKHYLFKVFYLVEKALSPGAYTGSFLPLRFGVELCRFLHSLAPWKEPFDSCPRPRRCHKKLWTSRLLQ